MYLSTKFGKGVKGMSMSIRPIAATNVSNVSKISANNVAFKANEEKPAEKADTVEISKKELTTEDKQNILKKARQKAAGYAFFGSFWSSLYYGLRSDEKVAKKYNLDVEKDKSLVKQIKREQFYATLPSVIPGMQFVGGAVAYIYCRNTDPADIKVKG